MLAEMDKMHMARELCADDWNGAHSAWLDSAGGALAGLPPPLALLATAFVGQLRSSRWSVCVPQPLPELCCQSALAMSCAGGESLHKLLNGAGGNTWRQEAAQVLIGLAVPFIGWLLLCKSSTHFGHVDPHPGN